MSHTYAHLGQYLDSLRDGGSTDLLTGTDASSIAQRAAILKALESSSRTVDAYCDRSAFGSGFGPRTASNKYDSWNLGQWLELRDDFLSISSVSVLNGTAGSSSSLVEDTDYYTRPYERAQKRELLLPGLTSVSFSSGYRVITVAGTAGYSNDTFPASATAGVMASTSVTTFTVGGTDDLFVGMTLLVDSEQLYLRAKTSTTATAKRGQNGTTAATHLVGAAIAYYVYPDEAVQATLLLAQRRLRMASAGITGGFDGAGIPGTQQVVSERSILNGTVGHLKLFHAA